MAKKASIYRITKAVMAAYGVGEQEAKHMAISIKYNFKKAA